MGTGTRPGRASKASPRPVARSSIGVSVTCRPENDEREWAAGREFIKYVGTQHILGIAVGNEIDLQVGASNGACISNLWNRGGYLRILQKRVDEFDAIPGMPQGLPVTSVFSMFSMNGYPFKWTVTNFLKGAWRKYGDRFRFSVNVYPQFSHGLAQAGCGGSINVGTKFSAEHLAGFIPNVLADIEDWRRGYEDVARGARLVHASVLRPLRPGVPLQERAAALLHELPEVGSQRQRRAGELRTPEREVCSVDSLGEKRGPLRAPRVVPQSRQHLE